MKEVNGHVITANNKLHVMCICFFFCSAAMKQVWRIHNIQFIPGHSDIFLLAADHWLLDTIHKLTYWKEQTFKHYLTKPFQVEMATHGYTPWTKSTEIGTDEHHVVWNIWKIQLKIDVVNLSRLRKLRSTSSVWW